MSADFRKKFIYITVSFAVIAVSLYLFTSRYSIGIAHQECLPERVWIINKTEKPVNRGEYISFKGRNIPRFKDTTVLTKVIAGVPGDTIVVKPATGRQEVTLNGMKKEMKIKATVSIVTGSAPRINNVKELRDVLSLPAQAIKHRFMVYEKGSDGRPLPFFYKYGTYVIPEGHYFVAGRHPASYDSRYWGVIRKENVVGKAYPIL